MQFHQLKPAHPGRRSQRVGRGGKRGTTSGRGTKGQKARAGHKIRPAERDILKKIPKLRGYKFKSLRLQSAVVNLADLEEKFKTGEEVSPKILLQKGLIRRIKGRTPAVRVLGAGELKKKLTFKDITFSQSAAAKISR